MTTIPIFVGFTHKSIAATRDIEWSSVEVPARLVTTPISYSVGVQVEKMVLRIDVV